MTQTLEMGEEYVRRHPGDQAGGYNKKDPGRAAIMRDLKSCTSMLTEESGTVEIIAELLDAHYPTFPPGDVEDALQDLVNIEHAGTREVSPSLVSHILLFNTEAIFTFAESPIEKIFLNALNIIAFPYNDIYLQFTHYLVDISAIQAEYDRQSTRKMVFEIWKKFQETSKPAYVKAFLEVIQEVDFLSEGQKEGFLYHLLYEYIAQLYGVYYITLQPTIKDIRVHGKTLRPDIYIWNPCDPKFKLIVECDGYEYHSDKRAFSQDRNRDRLLQAAGFQVFRFSGSEIIDYPVKCAEELRQYLREQNKMGHRRPNDISLSMSM